MNIVYFIVGFTFGLIGFCVAKYFEVMRKEK